MLKGKNVMRDIPRCVLTLPKSSVLKGPLRRTFAEGRSWQPGSSLADLPEDVVTVDRIEKRKVQNDIARSLVGGDVHGKHKPRLERWSGRALFRRGGLDRKFRSADEAADLLVQETLRRDPHQNDFAAQLGAFTHSIVPMISQSPLHAWVVKNLAEPESLMTFRVPWTDDEGHPRINRGFRVQYSSLLGPFFGGMRFAGNVTTESFRSLAFETMLQNALTGLDLGGARGGSDFSPVGKSEIEIRNFCQSFSRECVALFGMGSMGTCADIPIGDLGVGEREMGYMYGACKEITKRGDIVMGGRPSVPWHGDVPVTREKATGFGAVAAAERALSDRGQSLEGKRCLVSGSGNVALAVSDALLSIGAIPISLSDTSGFCLEKNGFNDEKLKLVRMVKMENPYSYHRRISEYVRYSPTAQFFSGKDTNEYPSKAQYPTVATNEKISGNKLWDVPCDYAFPCATEMELPKAKIETLIANGCRGVFECSDIPTTPEGTKLLSQYSREKEGEFVHLSSKVCNAGGTFATAMQLLHPSTSVGLEDVEQATCNMYEAANAASEEYAPYDLNAGANIAAIRRLANAMVQQGGV